MTKTQAIMKMLKGEKVKISSWGSKKYIYYDLDEEQFYNNDGKDINVNRCYEDIDNLDTWLVYVETLSFGEAFEYMSESPKNTVWLGNTNYRIKDYSFEYLSGSGNWKSSEMELDDLLGKEFTKGFGGRE